MSRNCTRSYLFFITVQLLHVPAALNCIPAVAVQVLINRIFVSTLQLSQVINCVDPLLTVTLMDVTQGMIVDSTTVNNVSLVTSIVTLEDIFTVLEDQHYTVSVSLTIINGTYTVTNTTSFSELITVKYTNIVITIII